MLLGPSLNRSPPNINHNSLIINSCVARFIWRFKVSKQKKKGTPVEYETDLVGDSGNIAQTNLSASNTKGLCVGFLTSSHCHKTRRDIAKLGRGKGSNGHRAVVAILPGRQGC